MTALSPPEDRFPFSLEKNPDGAHEREIYVVECCVSNSEIQGFSPNGWRSV
jgi:hypothetical protein